MSRVVVRDVICGHGHSVQSIQVEHTAFRRLLQERRVDPVRRQWTGVRFREWRRNVNNASQYVADIATAQAWIEAQQQGGARTRFEVYDGGKRDWPAGDGVSLNSGHTAAELARHRWRETDGFARIDE